MFNITQKIVFLIIMTAAIHVNASIISSVTFTDTQLTAGTYQYDLTLNNVGTTTIGTLWFSWVPGAGFMSVTPTNVQSPANWTEILTNGGDAIQWKTNTFLAPGATESGFLFDSTLPPANLEAAFAGPGIGTGDPIATYFVYIAAPLADPGFQGIATPTSVVPVPTTFSLFGIGIAVLASRRHRRQGAQSSG